MEHLAWCHRANTDFSFRVGETRMISEPVTQGLTGCGAPLNHQSGGAWVERLLSVPVILRSRPFLWLARPRDSEWEKSSRELPLTGFGVVPEGGGS